MDTLMQEDVIQDRLIEADGTPDSVWQAWPGLAQVPRLSLDDWVAPRGRVVVVAPHPDDEVLACGALIGMHAARGGDCLVVGVTDGEASHPGSAEWHADRLGPARRIERMRGLSELGLQGTEVLRFALPDGGVEPHVEQLAVGLRRLLRPTDLVIATWRLDGHPDHEATGRAAARACAAVGCKLAESPVWMWHWARPQDARVPWHRLRALQLSPIAIDAKRRALQHHLTQLAPRDTGDGPVLGAGILGRIGRDTEYFFV